MSLLLFFCDDGVRHLYLFLPCFLVRLFLLNFDVLSKNMCRMNAVQKTSTNQKTHIQNNGEESFVPINFVILRGLAAHSFQLME